MRRLEQLVVMSVLLLLLTSPGCLGRMAVTQNVRSFNMNAFEDR